MVEIVENPQATGYRLLASDSPSPMMLQWHACKTHAKEAILLFRLGDFYEAFHDDAKVLARELDLTLTQRHEIPMSGIPHHTSEGYIDKLVSKGYRVAVAEQIEDPAKEKGMFKREVVRIVTPGTLVNSSLLSDKNNNFFVSFTQVGSFYGLACIDLSTAEFTVSEFDDERALLNELCRLRPAECLVSKKFQSKHTNLLQELSLSVPCLLNEIDDWHFDHQSAYDFLINHFKVHRLDGFGLQGMTPSINAAGALLHHLKDTLCLSIHHILDIKPYSTSQYMSLDRTTQRNLELTESLYDGSRRNTLLDILDKTGSPMGGRLMRRWVKQPLLSVEEIIKRQEGVEAFIQNAVVMNRMKELMSGIRDIERLMMKISSGYATPRDLVTLRYSFLPMTDIKAMAASLSSIMIQEEAEHLDPLPEMTQFIARALVDEPPARIGEGKIFRDGFHPELDELEEISRDSKSWLARYQAQIREETGIKTVKVGFNKMFGYYIEVSKGQSENMPATFQRRQTLVNAERYITPELKSYESKVLTAEERTHAIEGELFQQVKNEVSKYTKAVLRTAQSLAKIDCLCSLAQAAKMYSYAKPLVDLSFSLDIVEGRHPIIETSFHREKFIPNDTCLDDEANRLILITGPNMAGKSTYIRQVALIAIMAQIGSFVPAQQAHVGLIDQVFTRIGASDDLTRGQSTFMVEMTETANILNNASSRSLVILDEIGRGTSTYDGISIAWAVAEYLLTTEGKTAKTLFATHYWELTKLEEKIPGAVNYHVAVHEAEETIIFLRKIVKGSTDKSYGIHVGRLAGLPAPVIRRAQELLVHLEENANRKSAFEPPKPKRVPGPKVKVASNELQLTLFG
jgi:DNA mismatch repair protein MutS